MTQKFWLKSFGDQSQGGWQGRSENSVWKKWAGRQVYITTVLYLKHPRGWATTLSVILHFSTGSICYQNPNKNSSVPIKTSCSFPENLCFKSDQKTEDNEQVTIQGCITAEQCRQSDDEHLQCCEGDLCNNSKCHGFRNAESY